MRPPRASVHVATIETRGRRARRVGGVHSRGGGSGTSAPNLPGRRRRTRTPARPRNVDISHRARRRRGATARARRDCRRNAAGADGRLAGRTSVENASFSASSLGKKYARNAAVSRRFRARASGAARAAAGYDVSRLLVEVSKPLGGSAHLVAHGKTGGSGVVRFVPDHARRIGFVALVREGVRPGSAELKSWPTVRSGEPRAATAADPSSAPSIVLEATTGDFETCAASSSARLAVLHLDAVRDVASST